MTLPALDLRRPDDWNPSGSEPYRDEGPLRRWASATREYGVGLLRHVDVGLVPPTPSSRGMYVATPEADQRLLEVAKLLGHPCTFAGKTNPRLIHDVFYVEEDRYTQLGSGSSNLEWHVEDGCFRNRTQWLLLLCMRGGPDVTTFVARVEDMEFSTGEVALLETTPIHLELDESFAGAGQGGIYIRTLTQGADGPVINFDPAFSVVDTPEASRVLEVVRREAERVRLEFTLEEGDLLAIDNLCSVHARTGFDPDTADRRRWVKRLLVSTADSLTETPGSEVIVGEFV